MVMRKYIVALLVALVLVAGAYVANTSGTAPQARPLPNIRDFKLR